MQTTKKNNTEKKVEPIAFTKKQVAAGSFKKKVERANELLSKTIFLSGESTSR